MKSILTVAIAALLKAGAFAAPSASDPGPPQTNASPESAAPELKKDRFGMPIFSVERTLWEIYDRAKRESLANTLKSIPLRPWKDTGFDAELEAALQLVAPHEWKAAKASAGNSANPKMLALRPAFERAVLATPSIRRIDEHLTKKYGLRVTGIDQEQLTYMKRDKEVFFMASVSLKVGLAPGVNSKK